MEEQLKEMLRQKKEQQEKGQEKLLRLKQVLELIPISKSSWWAGCSSGKYPQPIKLGEKTTVWKLSDINRLIASLGV
jgi:predicted DNA-binding transcriptional regulator AlpA